MTHANYYHRKKKTKQRQKQQNNKTKYLLYLPRYIPVDAIIAQLHIQLTVDKTQTIKTRNENSTKESTNIKTKQKAKYCTKILHT